MQPSPDRASAPIVEIFENLATPQLHAAAWAIYMSAHWRVTERALSPDELQELITVKP